MRFIAPECPRTPLFESLSPVLRDVAVRGALVDPVVTNTPARAYAVDMGETAKTVAMRPSAVPCTVLCLKPLWIR